MAPNVYTVTFEGKEKEPVYQIPNSDFENWGETALAEGWNSFESAAGTFASFASMSPMPEKIEGVEGNGVRLKSKDLWVAYANGNMTTGRINMGSANAADAANYNFTDRTDVNGNLPFAGEPTHSRCTHASLRARPRRRAQSFRAVCRSSCTATLHTTTPSLASLALRR